MTPRPLPLLYLCHTCLQKGQPRQMEGLLAIARQLLSLGANPNAEYTWNWHSELPRTALWAALITLQHVPLATALLEAGADPSQRRADGYTPHTLAELHGNHAIAAFLLARGAKNELSALEQFIAAAARADRSAADTVLAAHPDVKSSLTAKHHLMLHRAPAATQGRCNG